MWVGRRFADAPWISLLGRGRPATRSRRTLGQLLLDDEPAAALPHLRAAAEVAADDPINLFTYAQALLASDGDSHVAEADALFKQALRLAPVGV